MRTSTRAHVLRLVIAVLLVLGYIAWRTELFAHPMNASMPELGLSWVLAAALLFMALHSITELFARWWERGTRVAASILDDTVALHRRASPAEITAMNAAAGRLDLPDVGRKPGEELDAWLLAEAVTAPMGLYLYTHEFQPAGRAKPLRFEPPYGRHAAL